WCRQGRPFYDNSSVHVFPQRDKQFTGKRDDRRLLIPATILHDPCLEPLAERRVRLMAHPEPCNLDKRRSQPGVARLRDSLLTINLPTLPGRWHQTSVGGNLS